MHNCKQSKSITIEWLFAWIVASHARHLWFALNPNLLVTKYILSNCADPRKHTNKSKKAQQRISLEAKYSIALVYVSALILYNNNASNSYRFLKIVIYFFHWLLIPRFLSMSILVLRNLIYPILADPQTCW